MTFEARGPIGAESEFPTVHNVVNLSQGPCLAELTTDYFSAS
jgi:hypothetical protein